MADETPSRDVRQVETCDSQVCGLVGHAVSHVRESGMWAQVSAQGPAVADEPAARSYLQRRLAPFILPDSGNARRRVLQHTAQQKDRCYFD